MLHHALRTAPLLPRRLLSNAALRQTPGPEKPPSPPPSAPPISPTEYLARRTAVLSRIPSSSIAIYPSAPTVYMSADVPHLYHQNTDLSYLTGCAEPGSILVLDTSSPSGRVLLLVEERSAERERWDGPMHGVSDYTRAAFGVDDCLPTSALKLVVSEALLERDCARVFLDPRANEAVTEAVFGVGEEARSRLLMAWERDALPKEFVCGSRLIKSEAEIEAMRMSCAAMAGGLNDAMAGCVGGEEGVREKVIEARLEFGAKMRGAARMAFPSVVASGQNGTVLHYMQNRSVAREGDFVMVDAGCILGGACSDVSRSWPISGKFSGPQRDIYDLVLAVQRQCIEMCEEGTVVGGREVSMNGMHRHACRALTDGLQSLGFMKGISLDDAVAQGAYQKWFGHSIGHYLGMDVHDTHSASKEIPLRAGMIVTVEPGLYIDADDQSAPAAFRNLGMRIEDDVLVSQRGTAPIVLSADAAKSVSDVEALVGSGDSCAHGGLLGFP